MSSTTQLTPLMKQYFEVKNNFNDALVLFQVGDFYELFFDDAKKAANFLGIALTKRGNINGDPIPLCGVPLHAIDHYLSKLVKGGFKVAICDQLEEPVPGKVVRRGVTQVLTPGTLTDSKLLDSKKASYLFSFFPTENSWAMLFGELMTAQLFATLVPAQAYRVLESELSRFFPDEILIPENNLSVQFEQYFKQLGYFSTIQNFSRDMQINQVQQWLSNQFNNDLIKPIYENESLLLAMSNLYTYLKKNQEQSLNQFNKVHFYKTDDFLLLDPSTQKNLELFKNNQDNSITNSLFQLLDEASTNMGSRMIKKWLMRPLVKHDPIIQRQNAIETLISDVLIKDKISNSLKEIGDLERIIGRIALKRANLNDYLFLSNALKVLPEIKSNLKLINKNELLSTIDTMLVDFSQLNNLLILSLNDDYSKNWIIKPGYDQKLDNLRELIENGNQKILSMEQTEQVSTGISSLKIRYNDIFGYYIEVTKPNLHLVPQHYIRHQTLVGKERFVTSQLQELQLEIERAKKEIGSVEQIIFEQIKFEVSKYINSLRKVANGLSNLDALIGLAKVAYENGYVKPIFNNDCDIIIDDGKHPVISKNIGTKFISNDTKLNNEESFWIITGPNMGGKSTYLRQVALICIMAQCGSFVPAKSARLPILDRIFTRIGAGDNLAEGKSTFLVEMEETASICSEATQKSLVILDEVGRGTSTYDGLAIAQAVVEYINCKVKARCLFATHYHELTELTQKFPTIVAYHAASKKTDNGILFLHKIIKGTADGSFGIEVAKIANLPGELISRAKQILTDLHKNDKQKSIVDHFEKNIIPDVDNNKSKFIIDRIERINFDELSPKQAFDLLWQIKDELKSKNKKDIFDN